jgi:predicted nucleic acid-binding protein
MILVDTSVGVSHLRAATTQAGPQTRSRSVLIHPFFITELALGNLRQREIVLDTLSDLPRAIVATDAEVLRFNRHAWLGHGIG